MYNHQDMERTIFMGCVTMLLCLIVIFFLVNFFYNLKYKNFPPGPKPLPIIGNIHMLDTSKPYKTFYQLSKEYGSMFSFQMGMTKMVILCGYDTIYDALINNADVFSDRPHTPLFAEAIKGHGIVFTNGENWKVMRRFTLSTLKNFGTGKRNLEDKIIEEAKFLVQNLKSFRGKPFGHLTCINAAVTNIIVAILLSERFDYNNPNLMVIMGLVKENIGNPFVRLLSKINFLMGSLPGDPRLFNDKLIEFQSFIQERFTNCRVELDANEERNLINAFLSNQKTPPQGEFSGWYHKENLTMLVADLFGAGIETTSTTLRWSLLLMIKYPGIQKKVQNEIEKVIGLDQPKMEHRSLMPYTDAVIHEIQRFGDVAPITVPHVASQDVTFRGYFIPKGTPIIPVLHSINKDRQYFEYPHMFYPEHFLDFEGNFKKNEAFIPFSIGRRSCVGKTLAKMEIFLFFTTLLQHFTFKAPPGAELDLTPALGSTNPPKPFQICAIPRNHENMEPENSFFNTLFFSLMGSPGN